MGLTSCNSVSKLGTKIYASYYQGLVRFDEDEINPEKLTKINGLSDVGVKLLRVNDYNNKLLVIYENTNIDVIDLDGNIKNYSDFKLKSLNGKKTVNEVFFYKQYAYLACGFGIVVFDTEKMEVKDTYIIGANASNVNVFQIALNDSLIFAATELGMYTSNHKTKILNNFNNWKLDSKLPKGPYCGVIKVEDKIIGCYAPSKLDNFKKGRDTLYILKNNTWSKLQGNNAGGTTVYRMNSTYGSLYYLIDIFGMVVRDINSDPKDNINTVYSLNGVSPVFINDAYFYKDFSGNVAYWIGDNVYGLYRNYIYYDASLRVPFNGTFSSNIGKVDVFGGQVATAPSYVDITGYSPSRQEGPNVYKDQEWSYIPAKDSSGQIMYDINSVLIDRKDKSILWTAAWKYGIAKFKNNKLVSVKTTSNTPTMPSILPGEPRCSGLSMDKDGNLWFGTSNRINYLNVIKRNGEYINFRFDAQRFVRKTFVDKNNYVWALHQADGGITVFKHNGFNTPSLNNNYKVLTSEIGKGNLQANAVSAIAEDKDGKIWIGTSAGISVFYNPTAIFSGSDFDSQPIKIVQDGNVELLLGHETVLCLAVDGANNKWAGTVAGGLYCFSPDGQKQLYHFTKDNSPLYSDLILDLNYDETTGDIFIATDMGLQSFRSTILAGSEQYNDVVAFPNPVKPGYQGTVLVKGLLDNSIVKITDESGNMVWETKSTGGQIEWPITTFAGIRVTSGVYVVYASTTGGELKAHTKILVVN
ncbi:MAG: hypothetical protein IT236_12410 [Bacteroidia bacterium]|nr:hypothetical protein [Bacteroidia bacterium]